MLGRRNKEEGGQGIGVVIAPSDANPSYRVGEPLAYSMGHSISRRTTKGRSLCGRKGGGSVSKRAYILSTHPLDRK